MNRPISLFIFILLSALMVPIPCGCEKGTGPGKTVSTPEFTFAVISDIHYFDPDLGTEGAAFELNLSQDRKMLAESHAILKKAVEEIIREGVDFVLVAGDLTKDGERSSHEKVAGFLRQIEASGARVYAVPGNHDINNPDALSFSGDQSIPTPTVSAEEFAEIYGEFGFDEALYRDPESLSYIAEPVDGLWLFCMDACRYLENTDSPLVGGRFKDQTLVWIRDRLSEADGEKCVFGLMHHGIVEHFDGQSVLFPDYLVENWQTLGPELAGLGMRVVFTGHFHSQDIVKTVSSSHFLFDIETGSTATYPCPYRTLGLRDGKLTIRSERITSIDYDTQGMEFQDYAREDIQAGIEGILKSMLVARYGFSSEEANLYAPVMVQAIIAHYSGDEDGRITPEIQASIDQLRNSGIPMRIILGNGIRLIYQDKPPADNEVVIDIRTGETGRGI